MDTLHILSNFGEPELRLDHGGKENSTIKKDQHGMGMILDLKQKIRENIALFFYYKWNNDVN